MKKVNLLFLFIFPCLLTSCDYFKINFKGGPNNPSVDILPDNNYTYYAGDVLKNEDTFYSISYELKTTTDRGGKDTKDLDVNGVKEEFKDLNGFSSEQIDSANKGIVDIEQAKNVRQGETGLEIGNYSNKVNGVLSLNFKENIEYIELYVQPRWFMKDVEIGKQYAPDSNVAVTVNDVNKWIKVNAIAKEDKDSVYHKCTFKLLNNSHNISINVFGSRLYLNKIVTYSVKNK